MVRARDGSDPAAVVFDAIAAGQSRRRDTVLVDPAGRLHTRTNLMHEHYASEPDARRQETLALLGKIPLARQGQPGN